MAKYSVAIAVLILCANAFAGDVNNISNDKALTLMVGPSIVILEKPYESKHAEVLPYPAIVAVYDRFYWAIDKGGARLLASQVEKPKEGEDYWYFDAIGEIRSEGYDSDDSDQLDGMHNRHKTFDVGGEFGISGFWGKVAASLVTDMMGVDNGQELRVIYSKPFKDTFNIESLELTPFAGFAWQSDKLIDYYYGVRQNEARLGRPAYDPDSGVNWLWGIETNYKLNQQWTLFTSLTYYWLNSEIRHSPIVGQDYALTIIAGGMYRF